MNIAGADLNLLVVFDALMRERNVTRAGERIGMSQPAMSNALNRLRYLLKDDLFIRGPKGMRPTPRALDISGPLRESLTSIQSILDPIDFNPAEATSTLRLAMADYAASLILPPLSARIGKNAPNINLRVHSNANLDAQGLLDRGEIDFAVGYYDDYPERFGGVTMFEENYVLVMRPDHPLAHLQADSQDNSQAGKSVSMEDFIGATHLRVPGTGDDDGFLEALLKEKDQTRRVAMTVHQFLAVPHILLNSDLVMTLAARMARRFEKENNLHIAPLPYIRSPVHLTLIWHKQLSNHPLHDWMRLQLQEICKTV